VDEGGDAQSFNWGYDPMNYNVPEGSYSTDPHDGSVRVRELKEAVMALHANGLRVVMDVVYNHTYHLESHLFRTVPWYHYRQNPDGSAANGSGCGSEIASERSMCARYILDSVLYWAEEYHIDGFRFDLMGLLDVDLMNRIRQELDSRYGVGEKLVFGEPWGGGKSAERPGTQLCHKGHMKLLHSQIGAFCDDTRDAIKGSVFDVAVDLRPGSETYGKWFGVELTEENKKQFYIPEGFAHGFLVLSDIAEFCYKCTDFYHPGDEGGLAWNDPAIGIVWPTLTGEYQGSACAEGYFLSDGTPLNLSEKDQKWQGISAL
jgi:dTDP-4-dehydrorhamnose 3,5-epimerase-like enzyme